MYFGEMGLALLGIALEQQGRRVAPPGVRLPRSASAICDNFVRRPTHHSLDYCVLPQARSHVFTANLWIK